MRQWFEGSTAEGSARSWRWSGGCESRCWGSGSCETVSSEKRQVRRRACRHRRPHVWTLNDSSLARKNASEYRKPKRRQWRLKRKRERRMLRKWEFLADSRMPFSSFGVWFFQSSKILLQSHKHSLSLYYSLWDSEHFLTHSLSLLSLSSLRFQTITALSYI